MTQTTTPVDVPEGTDVGALLREFAEADVKYDLAKEAREVLRKQVLALVPKEIGKFSLTGGGFVVTVQYDEALKWSADDLAAYYGSDLPPYVKRALSIDLRALRRLPVEEQEELAKCYEQTVTSPKIDIATA